VTAPDPAAVLADDAAIEDIRAGRATTNRDVLLRALAAWAAEIQDGTS
jgi:hypothetical protein